MIMVDFFGVMFPTLYCVLLFFPTKVQKLSKIYKWQIAILLLAIYYHTKITTGNHTDVDAWILPQDWINQYYFSNHILSSFSTCKKHGASITFKRLSNKKVADKVCQSFNTKRCIFKECLCEHKCLECNLKDHGTCICIKQKQWE